MPKVEIKATALTEITYLDLAWADAITLGVIVTPDGLLPMMTGEAFGNVVLNGYEDEIVFSETLSALHTAAIYYEMAVAQGYRSGTTEWPNVARRTHNALLEKYPEMVEQFGFKPLPLL